MFSNFPFNPYSVSNTAAAGEPQSAYAEQQSRSYRYVHGQVGDGMPRRAASGVFCAGQRQFGGAAPQQAPTQPAENDSYGEATGAAAYGAISPHYAYTRSVPSPTNGLLNYRDGRFPSGYGCGYIDAGDLSVEGIGYGSHMPMQRE